MYKRQAQGNKITVVVGTDNPAQVTLTGAAKVNGKTFKVSSGPKSVTPGTLSLFAVTLPKALKKALGGLSSGKSVKVTITSSATDTVGRITTDAVKATLHGTHR